MGVVNISVNFSYPVIFTEKIFTEVNHSLLKAIRYKNVEKDQNLLFVIEEIIIDKFPHIIENIKQYCFIHKKYINFKGYEIIKGGEASKNLNFIEKYCKIFEGYKICRQSFVIIIGGGAFLDSIGFAASITHRGLRQIRIPTTVLSQNDSGVGVKNGINAFDKKNFIGTFYPPFAVINDFNFLKALGNRNIISGIAEAIKVAIIKDSNFFHWICDNVKALQKSDSQELKYLIEKTAKLHYTHIEKSNDPFEMTSSRPLDFGHWLAHKLEQMSNGRILHGEAVAIGISLDAYYAKSINLISNDEFMKITGLFQTLSLPIYDHLLDVFNNGTREVFNGIDDFTEHIGGSFNITLPKKIGCKTEVFSLDKTILSSGINFLKIIKD